MSNILHDVRNWCPSIFDTPIWTSIQIQFNIKWKKKSIKKPAAAAGFRYPRKTDVEGDTHLLSVRELNYVGNTFYSFDSIQFMIQVAFK